MLHAHPGALADGIERAAAEIDIALTLFFPIGAARFVARVAAPELHDGRAMRMAGARIDPGRHILAALELFVVPDIIHTALSPRFSGRLFPGLLVVIRSITSVCRTGSLRR